MQICLKHSVVMDVPPETAAALGWIAAKWAEAGLGEFTVTSAHDGQHVAGSQHFEGKAFDIRTRHLFDEQRQQHDERLHEFGKMLQREGFKVIVHPEWLPDLKVAPHLHVGIGQPIFERVD